MNYTRRNVIKTVSALAGASLLPLTGVAKTSNEHVPDLRSPMSNTHSGGLDELLNLFDFEKKAVILGNPLYATDNLDADFEKLYSFYRNIKGRNPELGIGSQHEATQNEK